MTSPAKICSTCRRWKPLTEFNRRTTSRDGRQWACRQCNTDYHRRNKKRHNAQIHARNKRMHAQTVRQLWAYLAEHPCTDCGETDPVVLEFDHLRDKRAKIASCSRLPWSTIAAEISNAMSSRELPPTTHLPTPGQLANPRCQRL